MYRLEHYVKNSPNKQFIVVDDEHKVFAIGNTGMCAYNPISEYTVTTHATVKELKNLGYILISRGYRKYNASSLEAMQEFRSIIQNK